MKTNSIYIRIILIISLLISVLIPTYNLICQYFFALTRYRLLSFLKAFHLTVNFESFNIYKMDIRWNEFEKIIRKPIRNHLKVLLFLQNSLNNISTQYGYLNVHQDYFIEKIKICY